MVTKNILVADDEQGYVEALTDALRYEGHNVFTASNAEDALRVLAKHRIDLVTVDVMMPVGEGLKDRASSSVAGLYLCRCLREQYPQTNVFCISVVNDLATIREVENLGARFLRKGETPLRTVLNMIRSKLTGIAYSTEREGLERRHREGYDE